MEYRTSKAITDQVLKPLATGLAAQKWTVQALDNHLATRLPDQLRKVGNRLAEELIQSFPATVAPDAARITQYLQSGKAAALLRRFAQRSQARAATPLDPPSFHPAPCFAGCALPALSTPDALADWLALTPEQLVRFSDPLGLSARADGPFAGHYRFHLRPKSSGGLRLLEEPKPLLKRLQRRILHGMLNQIPPHDAAYGFTPGRSAAQSASRHAGEAMVICFDLAAFFPSVRQHRVYALFRRMGYPAPVAQHLSGLTTAITPPALLSRSGLAAAEHLSNRHLPQGAPTSPAIANLVAFGLDTRLDGLARRLDATYTRYADDLTFSGDRHIAEVLQRAVPEIVQSCRFTLNAAKTRLQPNTTRQVVTGIVVNQHLNLPRADYDLLKAQIHRLRHSNDPKRHDPAHLTHLLGRIAWLEQLNPARGAKLRDRLAQALEAKHG